MQRTVRRVFDPVSSSDVVIAEDEIGAVQQEKSLLRLDQRDPVGQDLKGTHAEWEMINYVQVIIRMLICDYLGYSVSTYFGPGLDPPHEIRHCSVLGNGSALCALDANGKITKSAAYHPVNQLTIRVRVRKNSREVVDTGKMSLLD